MHPEKIKYTGFMVLSLYQTGLVLQMDLWIVILIRLSSTELCDHGLWLNFSGYMVELKNGELPFCCSDISLF